MQALLFLPGIMGTELLDAQGEKLWPPSLLETQFGYRRTDQLLADDVRPGDIIQRIACFGFYAPILQQFRDLGYREGSTPRRLYPVPYDWRLDLEHSAATLATRLDQVDQDGATEIVLVAHSMGGLICRLVLESGQYDQRPWFAKLKRFIAIATPHHGAPLALARVLGLDASLGIDAADFQRFTGDPRYPSAYQLLPAPSQPACWDHGGTTLRAVDIYDPATAEALRLNPALLARARWLHDVLAPLRRPGHVDYFFFACTGHETVTRVNVIQGQSGYAQQDMVVTRSEDAGDGTVPLWHALPVAGPKHVSVNEHSHAFDSLAFRKVFYRLLGGDIGPPLESLSAQEQADSARQGGEALRLSLPSPVVSTGSGFELLLVPGAPLAALEGTLVLRTLDDQGQPVAGREEPFSQLTYHGPPVSTLRLQMPAIARPGIYELAFVGQPVNSSALRFAATRLRPSRQKTAPLPSGTP